MSDYCFCCLIKERDNMQKSKKKKIDKKDVHERIILLTESLETTHQSIQEINNSLAILLGSAEWLRDNSRLNEKDKDLHLRIIINSIERIRVILDGAEKTILPVITKSGELLERKKTHKNTSPINILVVDDEQDFRIILDQALEKVGYTVMTAVNGEEAFQLFQKNKFDLVITDVHMPKVDGIQLMQQIKDENPWIPIIAISGFETESDIHSKVNKDDIYFLRKPFMRKELQRLINKALA